jgi:hypothetical protein
MINTRFRTLLFFNVSLNNFVLNRTLVIDVYRCSSENANPISTLYFKTRIYEANICFFLKYSGALHFLHIKIRRLHNDSFAYVNPTNISELLSQLHC